MSRICLTTIVAGRSLNNNAIMFVFVV